MMSEPAALKLSCDLFPTRGPPAFTVTTVSLSALTAAALRPLLDSSSAHTNVIGVSALFRAQKKLASLVFATPGCVLHVTGFDMNRRAPLHLLQSTILCNSSLKLVGFYLDRVAYSLFTDANVFLSNGVDLQSVKPQHQSKSRDTPEIFNDVLGNGVDKAKVFRIFVSNEFKGDLSARAIVQARECCVAALNPDLARDFAGASLVSTRHVQNKYLVILCKIHRDGARLDSLKPTIQNNDVAKESHLKKGKLMLQCERYNTRLRKGTQQTVIINSSDGERTSGRVSRAKGKTAALTLAGPGPSRNSDVVSVTTIGKDPLTSAEQSKEHILLQILQRKLCMEDNIVFNAIWMPAASPRRVICPSPLAAVTVDLNPSQHLAVMSAVAPLTPGAIDVQIVRGPPGTGKTTMIAATVQALRAAKHPVWLVAQSNVAVKNIAEKLAKVGFMNFKILVSMEFHFQWHEHLYGEKIEPKIIRSDTFSKLKSELEVERLLGGAEVLLCTMSMLSNHSLHEAGFTRVVPVETLIVDEASQIELGDYLPPVHYFGSTLQRMVFVGDDKQLAPFGEDQIHNLRSIFEVDVHRARAVMLETCYRLPTPICRFISRHVYENKLQSQHDIVSSASCRFIDVSDGVEAPLGHSWTNEQEANMCISVARQLYLSGRRQFRIITPYDPQRALIEKKLKEMQGTGRVPWEDRVFCVDSFQGNEAEHIIISVVRTTRPGFMRNLRRTNVMLTRCKRAMYICASRSFLQSDAGQETLVGKMAKEWEQFAGWRTVQDVLNGRV